MACKQSASKPAPKLAAAARRLADPATRALLCSATFEHALAWPCSSAPAPPAVSSSSDTCSVSAESVRSSLTGPSEPGVLEAVRRSSVAHENALSVASLSSGAPPSSSDDASSIGEVPWSRVERSSVSCSLAGTRGAEKETARARGGKQQSGHADAECRKKSSKGGGKEKAEPEHAELHAPLPAFSPAAATSTARGTRKDRRCRCKKQQPAMDVGALLRSKKQKKTKVASKKSKAKGRGK